MRRVILGLSVVLLLPSVAWAQLDLRAPSRVGRFDVFEATLRVSEARVGGNRWTESFPTAQVTTPSGRALAIDGFYYDTDTWKVRFAPTETGRYRYAIRLGDGSATGSFEAVPSANPGFIVPHPSNPYRYVYEATGSLFDALGFGTCVPWDPVDPFRVPGVDPNDCGFWVEGKGLDLDRYIERVLEPSRVNLFRWSAMNCTFGVWENEMDGRGDRYGVEQSRWLDELFIRLRARGIRIWFDLLGFGWNRERAGRFEIPQPRAVSESDRLRAYVRYAVARWGPYVDIWELVNEYPVSEGWMRDLAEQIHRIDPLRQDPECQRPIGKRRCRHPITASWARADVREIEINAPHWYQNGHPQSDVDTMRVVLDGLAHEGPFPKSRFPKPIFIAEAGDHSPGPPVHWDIGARLKAFSAFFNEAHLVFWEFGYIDEGKSLGGALFTNPMVRAYLAHVRTYTEQVDPDAVPRRRVGPGENTYRQVGTTRVYELASARGRYAYLVNPTCPDTRVDGLEIDLDIPADGTAHWYRPATGTFEAPMAVTAGTHRMTVPSFACDIAFIARADPWSVDAGALPPPDQPGRAGVADHPSVEGLNAEPARPRATAGPQLSRLRLRVRGRVSAGVTAFQVAGQTVRPAPDGSFTVEIPVPEGASAVDATMRVRGIPLKREAERSDP